jgi:hypothetical protein
MSTILALYNCLKRTDFWNMTPRNLVHVHRRYGTTHCPDLQGLLPNQTNRFSYLIGLVFDPEDGGSRFVRNVVKLVPDYAASQPPSEI